jgi:hypothetical protein
MQQQQQLAAQDPAAAAAISAAAAAAAPDAHLAVAGALAGQLDGLIPLQQGGGVAGTAGDAVAAASGAAAASAGGAAAPSHSYHTRRLQHSATSTPVAPPPAPRVTPASAGSRGRSTGTAPGSSSQRQQQPAATTPAAPVAHHYSTRKAAQRSSKLQPLQVPSDGPAEGNSALTPSAAGLQVPLVGASPWEMLLETVAGVTADEEQQEAVAGRSTGAAAPLLRRREPHHYQAPPAGYSQLLAGKLGPETHPQEQLSGPGDPRVCGSWQQAAAQPMEEDLASRFLESSEGEDAMNGEGGGGGMRRGALKLVCGSFRIQGRSCLYLGSGGACGCVPDGAKPHCCGTDGPRPGLAESAFVAA